MEDLPDTTEELKDTTEEMTGTMKERTTGTIKELTDTMEEMMNTMEECRGEPKTLTHQVIKLYMKIGHLHRDILDKEVRRTGVYRSQHQILMYLAAHPDASQKDIASFHDVSTATIAVTLKKMEKAGYIRRVVDQTDNRCNRIQLTGKGEEIVTLSREIFFRVEKEMFRGFDEEEKQRLKGNLERICKNLEDLQTAIIEGGRI